MNYFFYWLKILTASSNPFKEYNHTAKTTEIWCMQYAVSNRMGSNIINLSSEMFREEPFVT